VELQRRRLSAQNPISGPFTKRLLTSDIARTFDVLGWFSPSVIKAKILLQRLWERRVGWDEAVPQDILEIWKRWRTELELLAEKRIPCCHFPPQAQKTLAQLHGFCDASEEAFAAVVYLCVVVSSMCHSSRQKLAWLHSRD
jgi:hypothetical protein